MLIAPFDDQIRGNRRFRGRRQSDRSEQLDHRQSLRFVYVSLAALLHKGNDHNADR